MPADGWRAFLCDERCVYMLVLYVIISDPSFHSQDNTRLTTTGMYTYVCVWVALLCGGARLFCAACLAATDFPGAYAQNYTHITDHAIYIAIEI